MNVNAPGNWSPRAGEEENVDANESDGSLLGSFVVDNDISQGILAGCSSSEYGNKKLRHGHANGTYEQDGPSSPLVNSIKTGDIRADEDTAGNQTNDKLILEPRILEKLSAIVENKVDTGQLLKSLEQASSQKTLSKITLETFNVAGTSNAHLVVVVCLDLGKFREQSGIIFRETSELGKTLYGACVIVLLDQVAGGFGEDEQADHEDDGPSELDCDRDAVRAGIITVMGGIVHDGG